MLLYYVDMLLSYVDMLLHYVGGVVGFNGGKYAIPDRINNISVWKDRAEGCLWWPRTGKLETIMTFKSKVIFF